MALEHYRQKRKFDRTPEPAGEARPRKNPHLAYVIQKHDASRLHYDFRLELDGVLKSWAIPKGPSTDPGDKRLAVHVEDHPIEYGGFEGIIPKGQYGGGTVMLWDRGWWEPDGDADAGYAKGHLSFTLHGEKLRGSWSLVRLDASRQRGKQESWLLIKGKDEAATPGAGTELIERRTASVASRREMAAIARAEERVWHSDGGGETAKKPRAKARRLPDAVKPMLATLVDAAPEGDDWLHEIKFDGYRILARRDRDEARLISRNGLDWTRKFPEIAQSAGAIAAGTMLDGEVVLMKPDGTTDFGGLQDAISRGDTGDLVYMAFDLLAERGMDLRDTPLEERKSALAGLVARTDDRRLRYSDHQVCHGPRIFAEACKLGLEGIVSKRRGGAYRAGRDLDWRKTKCDQRDEFVIVGFTEPAGARQGFGALLLGRHDAAGTLVYAGRVGTGFSRGFLASFEKRLAATVRKRPTVALPKGLSVRGIHWVKPDLVAEIGFAQWTRDGVLRHARFVGLRDDKSPSEVSMPRQPTTGVRITHPDRVLFPAKGITKQGLADYYAAVADWILPYLIDRPLSMLRCPEGVGHECFFQKHLRAGVPKSLGTIEITEKHGTETYLLIRDLDGLLGLVQMGVIELHPWGSTARRLEQPDHLIFDLDPAEGLAWERVTEGALAVRDLLDALGLESFAKTSGGKGLHVVVPLAPEIEWPRAKEFAHAVAAYLAKELPDNYTATLSKQARTGRIFIDYLRNGRGATAVAPYSVRARDGATVSVPVSWDEVKDGIRADRFTLTDVPQRLAGLKTDPWAGFLQHRQKVRATVLQKLGVE